ncbi:MAG: peptidoglycan DD-metalloendopeptidase family protein [Oscillospiraceae bacterium]|nr:peptidoglycan DD-metalloendopeptidase family protein [Oscillospiraceae bacterium]
MKRRKRTDLFRRVIAIILAAIMALSLIYTALSIIGSRANAHAVSQSQIDKLKAQARELSAQKQSVQSEINSLKYDQLSATAKKTVLDNQISLTEQEIDNITEQIEAFGVMIGEKELEVAACKHREDRQWELYKFHMREMEENGTISYLAVVFDASSFSDLLARIDAVGDIMRRDENTYNQLTQTRLETVAAKESLEATKAEQEAERGELVSKQEELVVQLEESLVLIAEIDESLEGVTALYDQLNADSAKLQNEINAKVEELNRQEAAAAAAAAAKGTTNSSATVVGTGSLMWPSKASNLVTSQFGTRKHPIYNVYKTHNGIDIGASYGTNIYAADSGKVITSQYDSSYGNYVVISHGNGMTTLYAHMSSRKVSVGAAVTKGDVIGLVGSTGASTGAHLHFEVSLNGSRTNPLNYFKDYRLKPGA